MGFLSRVWARITSPGKTVNSPRRPWWSRGTTLVNEDAAMQVAAFNRGLIYISTQIAKLPWDIKNDKNEIQKGPLSNLLNLAPNVEMNAFTFRLVMIQQAIIHGNAFAEIERTTLGVPIALWPLNSSDMEILRTNSGDLVYRYTNETGGTVLLNPRDVFHIKNFHTKDGIVGQGVVSYGREVLGIQIAADTMAGGIFYNGGIPSGVLQHPGRMSDEAYKRLKDSWAEQQGGRKAGSTALLEEGTTYTPVNIDAEMLQFLQSRQFGVLEICRFLGLPPTKVFDVTAATYSNVENANLEVATDTLDSWATNLEMEADIKILNYRYGGRFTDINLYAIFRGDMKTRSDYFKAMMAIGAMTPNEARGLEGMAPYEDGNKYYIATNNLTPADRVDELIDADIENKKKPAAGGTPAPKQATPLEDAATLFLTGKSK